MIPTLALPPDDGAEGAPPAGPLAVAFSGGRDSTVLLHLLAHAPPLRARGLRALHVDHGLRPESAGWATHCAGVCATLGVPFETRRVDVVPGGDGPEAAARAARYAAFAQWQQPGETIVLAHHRDDQAETVLLRLLRGAGDGLAGMRVRRPFGTGWLWRPLLHTAPADLQAYAETHALRWIEDPSNTDTRYDRNHLRAQVLPALAARWPAAAASLARSASLLATQADLLAGEDTRRLAEVQGFDPATLHLDALRGFAPAWRDRMLRAWLASLGLPPLPAGALATIAAEVIDAGADAEPCFAWHGAELRRWRGMLHAGRPVPALPADWEARWDGRAPIALPTGQTLRLAPAVPFAAPVLLRARAGGERLRLPGRDFRSELKHVLQDLGVPPWRRPGLPLLFATDGELLAAGDLVVSATLRAWLDDAGTRLRLD